MKNNRINVLLLFDITVIYYFTYILFLLKLIEFLNENIFLLKIKVLEK